MPKSLIAIWIPKRLQGIQFIDGAFRVGHGRRFGHFQLKVSLAQTVPVKRAAHCCNQIRRTLEQMSGKSAGNVLLRQSVPA